MILKLADWPIASKFLIAPLVVLSMLTAISCSAYLRLQHLEGQIHVIVDSNIQGSALLNKATQHLQKANGGFYMLATDIAAKKLTGSTDEHVKELQGQLEQAIGTLERYNSTQRDNAVVEQIKSSIVEIQTFRDTIELVGSLLDLDFASAVSTIEPFRANYVKLEATFNALLKKLEDDANHRAAGVIQQAQDARILFLKTTLAAILVGLLVSVYICISTRKSVLRIASATQSLAENDTQIDIEALQRKDELGRIVKALVVFRDNILQVRRLREEQERQALQAEADKKESLRRVVGNLQNQLSIVVSKYNDSLATVISVVSGMTHEVQLAEQGTSEVKVIVEDSSQNITSVASASEELSAAASEISASIMQTSAKVGDVSKLTEHATQQTKALAEAGDKINSVVELIRQITEQINLLSLNATIESARAGEAGKGFSVVAAEVKQLATSTGKATQEVGGTVLAMQSSIHGMVDMLKNINESVSQIDHFTSNISAAVEEQTVTTRGIASNMTQIASKSESMSVEVTKVARNAMEAGNSSRLVLDAAQSLQEEFQSMVATINGFLDEISN